MSVTESRWKGNTCKMRHSHDPIHVKGSRACWILSLLGLLRTKNMEQIEEEKRKNK